MVGRTGAATGTFQFLSANPDQTQNLAYTLALVGSVVVPEPWSLALLISGVAASRSSDGVGRRRRLSSESADSN